MRKANQEQFSAHIRAEERVRNVGHLTEYRPRLDITRWTVAGVLVGISQGPIGKSRAYYLDRAQ
jgi:hypothetical protein